VSYKNENWDYSDPYYWLFNQRRIQEFTLDLADGDRGAFCESFWPPDV